MFSEQLVATPEVMLNVACGPAHGPPLVLLHGVVRRWTDFAPLLPILSPRWHVHGVDARGHGLSGRVPGRYLVADYVRDVATLLREELAEPAVIYGHSLGAMVALGAAAAAPDRVRGVILEDPPFHTMGSRIGQTPYDSQFREMQRIVRPGRPLDELWRDLRDLPIRFPGRDVPVPLGTLRDPTSLRYSARCLMHLDPDVLAPIVAGQWLDGYDWQAAATTYRGPLLVLQGDVAAGGMLTDEDARHLARLAPHAIVQPLPGVGHLIHWMEPVATQRLVLNFLESLR